MRVHRPQYSIGIHDDLIGRQGDQGPATHGIVRHEHAHGRLMAGERMGDLGGGQHESPGRVQLQIDGDVVGCEMDRPQDLLRVRDIDIAGHRDAQEANGFLPVDEGDDP